MSNYISLNSDSKKMRWSCSNIYNNILHHIPIGLGILACTYIILMSQQITTMTNSLSSLSQIITHLNQTQLSTLVTDLIQLEKCVLNKLQIC